MPKIIKRKICPTSRKKCVLDISSFVIRFLALLFISDTKIH